MGERDDSGGGGAEGYSGALRTPRTCQITTIGNHSLHFKGIKSSRSRGHSTDSGEAIKRQDPERVPAQSSPTLQGTINASSACITAADDSCRT